MTQPDPNASGTGESQSDETGKGQGATGTTEETVQSGGTTSETSSAEATVSRSDYEKALERMRAADQNRSKAEAELKQLKEKDLPEQEKLRTQLSEVTARAEKAEEDLKAARLNLAFFNANKHKWVNPATALKLADLSKVEIDDDGTVRGMDAALDALAKSDPYLIQPEGDGDGGTPRPQGSTGAPSNGGRNPGSGTVVAGMVSRIPALRTRGIGTKPN